MKHSQEHTSSNVEIQHKNDENNQFIQQKWPIIFGGLFLKFWKGEERIELTRLPMNKVEKEYFRELALPIEKKGAAFP